MTKNLLFIPTYRCATQIARVLNKLSETNCEAFERILVIDNRSFDETVESAKNVCLNHSLKNKIAIVINSENFGLGGSHKAAFQYAIDHQYDHVVILHGDDQGEIDDFQDVFKLLTLKRIDHYIFGARFHPESRLINYSRVRIFGNKFFNLVSSILTKKHIQDLGGSGLNVFPVHLLKAQKFQSYSNDLTFHVYLLLGAVQLGQLFQFQPISWKEEDQISNVRMLRQVKKLVLILVNYLFSGKISSDQGNLSAPPNWKTWEIQHGSL